MEHPVFEDRTIHVEIALPTTTMQVFFCSEPQLFSLPMEGFFTRRAGPLARAWPQRHGEKEFLDLVRHNAATKLEMDQRPPLL